MFGFINDYIKNFNLKNDDIKFVYINNNFLCVQGFLSVLKIEQNSIALKTKTGELLITGENLNIKELSLNEIKIVGEIFKIER